MPPRDYDDATGGRANGGSPLDVGVAMFQAALLPASVPVLPRVALGARYLPADVDTAAGGDWFDAVVRPDGSLGLVVGDAAGSGVAASAAMGQLRAVARHCLESAASPAAVITGLDHYARQLGDAHTATVCVVVLHPTTGSIRYSTAGHPPPLVIAADGHRYLAGTGGAPLAAGATYAQATDWLAEGDLLLLYTDGIIERPGIHPGQGCAELAAAAARWGRLDGLPVPQRMCDQALAELTRTTGSRDDATLLAALRHAPVGKVELTLPNTPLAVPTTRAALAGWLVALRVDDDVVAAIQHAVDETVSNAVEHAYRGRPGAIDVRAELTAAGIAEITVADEGRWREPVNEFFGGMGLTMASELVDDVRIDRRESGTIVHLRHRLNRPITVSTSSLDTAWGQVDDEPFLAALTTVNDPAAVLIVSGPVDAPAALTLRDQLCTVTGNGTVSRAVDLSRVTLLGSAAVHVLHEACNRSAAQCERLRLLAPRGSAAHHVLELVGLHPSEDFDV